MKFRPRLPALLFGLLLPTLPFAATAFAGMTEGVSAGGLALPAFDRVLPESEGFFAVVRDGAAGYVDASGQWVIPPRFKDALPFVNGRAIAWRADRRPVLIDRSGTEVGAAPDFAHQLVHWQPTEAPGYLEFSARHPEGYELNGVMTYDGTPVVQTRSLVAVSDAGIVEYVDKQYGNGEIVAVYRLDGTLVSARPYPLRERQNNFSRMRERYASGAVFRHGLSPRWDAKKKAYGYVNEQGEWVIKPQYLEALPFFDKVAVVVTDESDGPRLQEARLIDTRGKTVAKLPDAYCYSGAENGMVAAILHGKERNPGALIDYSGKVIATVPPVCPPRIHRLDSETLVVDTLLVRNDGRVLRDGSDPLPYGELQFVDARYGIAFFNVSPRLAAYSLEAQRQKEAAFWGEAGLRRIGNGDWERLPAPAYHPYVLARLYISNNWSEGQSLLNAVVQQNVFIKARDGRSVRDPDIISGVAGCRPPAGYKLLGKDLIYPGKKTDLLEELGRWQAAKTAGQKTIIRDADCEWSYLVDGQLERR